MLNYENNSLENPMQLILVKAQRNSYGMTVSELLGENGLFLIPKDYLYFNTIYGNNFKIQRSEFNINMSMDALLKPIAQFAGLPNLPSQSQSFGKQFLIVFKAKMIFTMKELLEEKGSSQDNPFYLAQVMKTPEMELTTTAGNRK